MQSSFFRFISSLLLATFVSGGAFAQEAPDKFVEDLSSKVIDLLKSDKEIQAGDLKRISQLVDTTLMPHVNFERMTALSVGRAWRDATPEQKKQLMTEFRILLLRTYSNAFTAVRDQSVNMKPYRGNASDTEVIVRSEIVQARGEPIQLDYRLEKADKAWRIYDVNVLGVWLVQTYRNQFAQEISAGGIDGLIKSLADKNKSFASAVKS
ncbi:MAG: ABC transporter substrate-binding protein [Lautropia sp.]|nr:ABC transporter substrate-binding protein [Lautropia sp.]